MEIGIRVDILRGIFLGRLDESLLGEHALHGVVCVRGNRIVKGKEVWERRCGWRGVCGRCLCVGV